MPTGCSPDVVHLVICASKVFWFTFWIPISLVSKEVFFEDTSISVIFSTFWKDVMMKIHQKVDFGVFWSSIWFVLMLGFNNYPITLMSHYNIHFFMNYHQKIFFKMGKNHWKWCIFKKSLYQYKTDQRSKKCVKRLVKHILSNGPHLGSTQWASEVHHTHILGALSNYFRKVLMEDPVFHHYRKASSWVAYQGASWQR